MERADQVLALRQVDRGLAADGGVDLREQRGGRLHDRDPAVVDGRGEAGRVAHHSPAQRDHHVVAQEAPRGEAGAQVVDGGERLGVFTLADEEQVGGDVGLLECGDECGRVEVGDPGLAHHRDAPAADQQRARVAEHTGADDHVVRRVGQRDGHPLHARNSSRTVVATSSGVRPSVSTRTWAAAS